MRKVFLLMMCLSLFVVYAVSSSSQAETGQSHKKWLQDRYKEATSIKVGMSRADLLKVFMQDGGLNIVPASRYVLRSCYMIKIDVEFDSKYGREYKERPDSELKIRRVSKPYLEYMFTD